MTDIANWIHGRHAADRDLDRTELARLAVEIGRATELWAPFERHDPKERFYHQLYRDPNVDVWLICWLPGQGTGYHDHDRSNGAVYVCRGALYEDYFCRDPDGWIREKTNRHETGGCFDFDAAHIHGVRHAGEGPATSVHVYSPALWRMGHYEPDTQGVMRRVAITYADELLGAA
ncbi:MAG TPA: cysteine dioxygenase family protein [Gaiellaceae bacterium]|nr:cysteine dioxygenase family protein [Gaiellaceae bacterium]